MAGSCEDILELLKGELEFLESGGFRHCPRSPWCAHHNFAESPICPSFSELARKPSVSRVLAHAI
jgi:hypothetical protein